MRTEAGRPRFPMVIRSISCIWPAVTTFMPLLPPHDIDSASQDMIRIYAAGIVQKYLRIVIPLKTQLHIHVVDDGAVKIGHLEFNFLIFHVPQINILVVDDVEEHVLLI